jgi:HEAT repeat protein
LAVVGALGWLLSGGCAIDREITKPPEKRDLTRQEIWTKLQSPDFKQKLEAETQIDKLEPVEKRRILLELSRDSDPAVRLIAVKHLAGIDHPEVHARLAEISKSDPDPTVREIAR